MYKLQSVLFSRQGFKLEDAVNWLVKNGFDVKKIDAALLRKGRLIAKHKFESLSIEESKILVKHLNLDPSIVKKPMTLAEIYNYKDNNFDLVISINTLHNLKLNNYTNFSNFVGPIGFSCLPDSAGSELIQIMGGWTGTGVSLNIFYQQLHFLVIRLFVVNSF